MKTKTVTKAAPTIGEPIPDDDKRVAGFESGGSKYEPLVAKLVKLAKAKSRKTLPIAIPAGADPEKYRLTIYSALYRYRKQLPGGFVVRVLEGKKQLGIRVGRK